MICSIGPSAIAGRSHRRSCPIASSALSTRARSASVIVAAPSRRRAMTERANEPWPLRANPAKTITPSSY